MNYQRTPTPWNITLQELSQRPQHQDQAPLKDQPTPVLDASHQTFSKTQPFPLAERLSKAIPSPWSPQNTSGYGTALKRDKIQPHPPEYRHKSSQPGNLHKALVKTQPCGTDSIFKRKYNLLACRKVIPNTVN